MKLAKRTVMVCVSSFLIGGTECRTYGQSTEGAARLTLREAVERAMETHPRVQAALASEDENVAALGEASSARYPQLSGQSSVTQFEEPMVVAPFHRLDLTRPPQFERTLIRGQLALDYTLFDGGARKARVSGARAQSAGASAEREAVEQALTAGVSRAYLEVLTAGRVLDAQERRLESLTAERRRVAQLLAEGRAARVEVLRVDAALARAEADRVAASARLELAERELARLVDAPSEEVGVELLHAVRLRGRDLTVGLKDLVDRARESSPAVERNRQSVEAALADERAASATWIPRVDVLGAYQLYSSTAGDVTAEWQAGLGISYPLFTGGARSSAVARARARVERAREQLRLTELELETDIDRAWTAAVELHARVEAVREEVQHQGEVVRIEQLSLQAGAGTQTDYLRAEADLAGARSSLVEAEHSEIAAWVELARVTGELTPKWLEENLETLP